jgi:hypothetical protein
MSFSFSTFTLEINSTPAIVFRAKWASSAEDIGFAWARDHSKQISSKGPRGSDLPAIVKVRIARATERTAYETADSRAFYDGTKIVYLPEFKSFADSSGLIETPTQYNGGLPIN